MNDNDEDLKVPPYQIDQSPPIIGRYGTSGTIKEFKEHLNKVIQDRKLILRKPTNKRPRATP